MNKKFILVYILFTPIVLFSQTWKTQSAGNDFDGTYKHAYIQGVGEEFPYNEPFMGFIKWDNLEYRIYENGRTTYSRVKVIEENPYLYIQDAGFFQPDTGIEIIFVFDNEPGVLYRTYPYSLSAGGKTLFFNGFTNSEDLVNYSIYEILQKLMTASSVSVRLSDRFGQNDTKFNLSGSTKAINYVLPESEMNVLIEKAIKDRNEELAVEQKKIELLGSLLEEIKLISLSDESLERLEIKIKRDLGINWSFNKSYSENIVSIKYEADFESDSFNDDSEVDIFYILKDGKEKKIYSSLGWELNSNSILFEEAKKAEEEKLAAKETAINNVKNILKKYVFQDIIDLIFEEIKNKESLYGSDWTWTDIENVKVIFNKKVQGILLDSITVFLNDGDEEELNVFSSRKLKNRKLKQIGATLGELF